MDQYQTIPEPASPPHHDPVPAIGLMPGSRDSEVRKLLPTMLAAARLIGQRRKVRFLLSQAPSVDPSLVQQLTSDSDVAVTLFRGETGRLLQEATVVIVASGTSTLEAALHQTPMIIVYKVSPLSYKLGKALIRVPHIGLVNLIAGERVAPELIQHAASPDHIAGEAIALLDNPNQLARMRQDFLKVARRLGGTGASDKVAGIALQMIDERFACLRGKSPAKDQHGLQDQNRPPSTAS